MKLGKLSIVWGVDKREERAQHRRQLAHRLGEGCAGSLGDTVDAVQDLILDYYDDVQDQADRSFKSARNLAFWGFLLLVLTVAYVITIDWFRHMPPQGFTSEIKDGMSVGWIGIIGGAVVEFLAGTQFFLHGRTSRQFGAFHICLERTHRYLLSYKIAGEIKEDTARNGTLEKIVCIMANAPMISRKDIEGDDPGWFSPLLASVGARTSGEKVHPTVVTVTGAAEKSTVLIPMPGAERTSPEVRSTHA